MKIPSYRRDGSVMDLANPAPGDIDWADIAETLAKTPRFGGRHPGNPYSVAQHCVMGADALWAENANRVQAAQFLLHDAHEAFIGDLQRPVQRLFDSKSSQGAVAASILAVKHELDRVIFGAARISLPLFDAVKDMDERMCRAEAIHLFGRRAAGNAPAGHLPVPMLSGSLKPWGWAKAMEEWLIRFQRYAGHSITETVDAQ